MGQLYGPPLPARTELPEPGMWSERPHPFNPVQVPLDGLPHRVSVTPDPGTRALGFTFPTPSQIAQLQVIGLNSGIDYAAHSLAGVDAKVTVRIFTAIDPSVAVLITTNLGSPPTNQTAVNIAYLSGPEGLTIDSSELPMAVFLQTPLGQALSTDSNGSRTSLAVSERWANPAPWQAANLRPIRLSGGFPTTQATALELIQGVVGQAIRIFCASLGIDITAANSGIHLVDALHGNPAGGAIIGDISTAVANPAPLLGGGPLTAGNSLYIWQDVASTVGRGWLSASQG